MISARFRHLLTLLSATIAVGLQLPAAAQPDYEKELKPLLMKYCSDCHADGVAKGELDLDEFKDTKSILADWKPWASIQFQLENMIMPPEDKDQPTLEEREKMVRWIDTLLNPVDPKNPDPGRVTIRRLNKAEYNNTVRDLLGVDLKPASEFPDDDSGYGFDNIGDVLALPPILLERYLIAADRVLLAAVPPDPPAATKTKFGPGEMHGPGFPAKGARLLAFSAETTVDYTVPWEGEYIIRAVAWGDQAGDEPARMEILGPDGKAIHKAGVKATEKDPQTEEARVKLKKGAVKLAVAFTNDFYDANIPDESKRDRNLWVRSIEIEGPLKAKPNAAAAVMQPMLTGPENEVTARAALDKFAARAFRRAVLPGEVDRLVKVYAAARAAGEGHRGGLRQAMKAGMISPYFLFRIEWQPEPDNPEQVVDLNEFALASRLSYWLWSSMPDDELLSLAFRNQLRANLRPQITRMLKDPKVRALPDNFGGQWLELRTLDVTRPDKERFPRYSAELRDAFRRETDEFFLHIIRENRSVFDFIAADYSWLNQRLAEFYGIPGVQGNEFRQVKLPPESRRRGVLTHGSVLTVTSEPTRTSPVKRGKWVIENILGIPSPPPPPNVPALEEGEAVELTGSLRQRFEAHRSKTGCTSCHRLLDPLGFGLENFDGIGQWREKDGKFPVDSSGVLTTGEKFGNAGELTDVILTKKSDAFVRCLVQKMMTYALGRGIASTDRLFVEEVMRRMKAENHSFQSMIMAIAESVPFQKRRGDKFRK